MFKRLFWLTSAPGFGFGASFWAHACRAHDDGAAIADARVGRAHEHGEGGGHRGPRGHART